MMVWYIHPIRHNINLFAKHVERWHGAVNCLTIDFDIIMRPSIELYNDLIDNDFGIQDLEHDFPVLTKVLPPDLYIYNYLTRFLIREFKKLPAEKVFFVESHEKVAKLLEGQSDVMVCNIDHHHDVAYEMEAKTPVFVPGAGNWLKYLKDKGIVTYYTWVHNPNSSQPDDDLAPYIDSQYELQQMDLETVPEIDMLIICNSPEWIPSDYQELWNIWVSIAEEWYGTEFSTL